MPPTSAAAVPALAAVVPPVDAVLQRFLAERRAEAASIVPSATEPIDEIERLVDAGGKRLRPAFCYWGYRAAGGVDADTIWRVAAAIELLHTMALIHDDVMDADELRRGEPTAQARQTALANDRGQEDPARVGRGVAIVAGDLAAAFAEQLFTSAKIPSDRWVAAASRFHRMRLELAVGAYLDLARLDVDPTEVAYLKGGAYTVEAPALIGSAVAADAPEVDAALRRFARPLGEAFQLLDDLADGDAPADATRAEAEARVAASKAALGDGAFPAPAAEALHSLADLVGSL
jgi:geranylgeranyl diphosphate synthase type I